MGRSFCLTVGEGEPGSLPLIIFLHPGNEGVCAEAVQGFEELLSLHNRGICGRFVYVIPSFRGEPLIAEGKAYLSDGDPSYLDSAHPHTTSKLRKPPDRFLGFQMKRQETMFEFLESTLPFIENILVLHQSIYEWLSQNVNGVDATYALAVGWYFIFFLIILYFLTRKIHYVHPEDAAKIDHYPSIVMLYPLLQEGKETIYTTLIGHKDMDYPSDRWRIIAVTNWFDYETSAHIRQLMLEFSFLDLIVVPPCTDSMWDIVWEAWENNLHCYWWQEGKTQRNRDLPRKKTRQLIYAFYHVDQQMKGEDWVLDYIDADSVSPIDHFKLGVAGLNGQYDLIQSSNVAGNLLDSMVASVCALDHMIWDGFIYPHTSDGHPYYCLGKGLFVRASDVKVLGSWNPYITIEDPEAGLRFWKNGRKLGIIASPLVEEVPRSFSGWLHQRNRWMCGFFQTLSQPLASMHFTAKEKLLARMNFIPTLSSPLTVISLPIQLWVHYNLLRAGKMLAWWLHALSFIDLCLLVVLIGILYSVIWKRTAYVLNCWSDRLRYLLRVNPVVMWISWMAWSIPLFIGFLMFLTDKGKAWKRTDKVDANHDLIRALSQSSSNE